MPCAKLGWAQSKGDLRLASGSQAPSPSLELGSGLLLTVSAVACNVSLLTSPRKSMQSLGKPLKETPDVGFSIL